MRFLGQLIRDRLEIAKCLSAHLKTGGAFKIDRQIRRFLNGASGREISVMSKDDGSLVAQGLRNQLPFLICDRNARPVGKEGTIIMERRHIHLRHYQGLSCGRQCGSPGGVGVNDRLNIGPRAIDPRGGIG